MKINFITFVLKVFAIMLLPLGYSCENSDNNNSRKFSIDTVEKVDLNLYKGMTVKEFINCANQNYAGLFFYYDYRGDMLHGQLMYDYEGVGGVADEKLLDTNDYSIRINLWVEQDSLFSKRYPRDGYFRWKVDSLMKEKIAGLDVNHRGATINKMWAR